jgi:hypothetical protein
MAPSRVRKERRRNGKTERRRDTETGRLRNGATERWQDKEIFLGTLWSLSLPVSQVPRLSVSLSLRLSVPPFITPLGPLLGDWPLAEDANSELRADKIITRHLNRVFDVSLGSSRSFFHSYGDQTVVMWSDLGQQIGKMRSRM